MKKRRFWIFALVLVVAAGIGAYVVYTNMNTAVAQGSTGEEVQTAVARRGEIIVSAIGAGTVIAAQEVELAFDTSGTLTEMLAQVGDKVAAGDVLARVDDTAVQEALTNAQIAFTKASMQTDASATETGISFDDINLTNAQIALDEAQAALDELLNWEPDEDDIAQAQASLSAAQAGYSAAVGQATATGYNLELEEITLAQAEAAVVEAQAAHDTAFDPGREWELYTDDPSCLAGQSYPNCTGQPYSTKLENERQSATNALAQTENLQIAPINYDAVVASSGSSSTASANSSVVSAQLALKAAQTGPTEDEITAAKTAVRQAELALQQVMLNVESNKLDLEQAQLNLAAAEADVAGTELVAPIDGTVTAVNYNVGETVGGTVIILADLEQPLIEIYLDESDLNMVGLGYAVEVTFDALPDQTFDGEVVQIDPQLTTTNGVTAVRALVRLTPESYAKPQSLPVGMNATVEVISGQTENAVLVPVEALREISTDQYAIFVMNGDTPELRMVEVGLMDYSFAEILSGLDEGEVVTTGLIQTQE